MMETPKHSERHNPEIIGKFISLVASFMIADEMSQTDYDKLREIAAVLNPSESERGFVGMLNRDVNRQFPEIQIR